MKIKISESESHLIELPEEISAKDFFILSERFGRLSKIFSKDDLLVSSSETKEKVKYKKKEFPSHYINRGELKRIKKDRTIVVKLFEAYYNKDRDKFNKVRDELELTNYLKNKYWMTSSSGRAIRELHNITPNEIGLKKFPAKGESVEYL